MCVGQQHDVPLDDPHRLPYCAPLFFLFPLWPRVPGCFPPRRRVVRRARKGGRVPVVAGCLHLFFPADHLPAKPAVFGGILRRGVGPLVGGGFGRTIGDWPDASSTRVNIPLSPRIIDTRTDSATPLSGAERLVLSQRWECSPCSPCWLVWSRPPLAGMARRHARRLVDHYKHKLPVTVVVLSPDGMALSGDLCTGVTYGDGRRDRRASP